MFTIAFSEKFKKQLRKFDKKTESFILRKVNNLKNGYTNNNNVVALVEHKFDYRLRIGNYRVLFKVEKDKITFIGLTEKRGDVYK